MVFNHALALNDPFGFDEQDIRLNRLCAQLSYEILVDCFVTRMGCGDLIDKEHETPFWLENSCPPEESKEDYVLGGSKIRNAPEKKGAILRTLMRIRFPVIIGMTILIIWGLFIVFLTWALSQDKDRSRGDRWWSLYIPLDTDTTGYVSLGVFILLGFWVDDAYGRFWRALQLWEMEIRPKVTHFAFQLSIICKRGLWHERDRERLLSYLAALPYAVMLHLRGSRDVSVFGGILSPKDISYLAEAPALHAHIMNVIYAYISKADVKYLPKNSDMMTTFGSALLMIYFNVERLEASLLDCDVIQKFPLSPTFTLHLQIYTIFWLALLPLMLVIFHGFLSFIFLIPIGFSIINLLCVGSELSDPFGFDKDDLPLRVFCDEIKASVRDVYLQTERGVDFFIRESKYDRKILRPQRPEEDVEDISQNDKRLTLRGSLWKLINWLPSVPMTAQVIAILWSVIGVLVSWGLSKVWKNDRQEECAHWCSPVDVQAPVLGDVGFALFMILTFRASDAITRYNDGARIMSDLEMNLRNIALEVVQVFPDATFHQNDKERIIAHLAQIPLCFRDMLLGISRSETDEKVGVLSDEDLHLFEDSPSPLDHLLRTVESYFITANVPNRPDDPDIKDTMVTYSVTHFVIKRMHIVRGLLAQALCVKRFPIIRSYRRHQLIFAVIWLIFLPFSLTPFTGFFAILWSSVISYAVLSMEHLATRLADPFGRDSIDLPIETLCKNASAVILGAVDSVNWDCDHHIRQSDIDQHDRIGVIVSGRNVYCKHSVASSDFPDMYEENDKKLPPIAFSGPRKQPTERTLYAHLLRSVPWLTLVAIIAWTAIACTISYIVRNRDPREPARWWTSRISVSGHVTTHLSIAAFALLSFYVRASFVRYDIAGTVWYDYLRAYCHAILAQLVSYWSHDELHSGDHRRVVGHIAALPIVLKHELRHSRDIREIKALVSSSDLARIECAESMSAHCLDVVRAYFYKTMARVKDVGIDKEQNKNNKDSPRKFKPGRVTLVLWNDLIAVEKTVQDALHLNRYDIAPGFLNLLKTLLSLWFIILPFVLAEQTGWFTILWVSIIAYGLLGMFSVAAELQHPFGSDLNDFNLNKEADHIVVDILDTYRRQPNGFNSLVQPNDSEISMWTKDSDEESEEQDRLFAEEDNLHWSRRLKRVLKLAARPVQWWMLVAAGVWAAVCVSAALLVSINFPQKGGNKDCAPWFCSAIAIDEEVKEYIGFVLFMLLGFRLTDSHFRYVRALRSWQGEILGMTRLVTSRLFASYKEGTWHKGDLQRLAGHIAANSISIMGGVRNRDYRDKLNTVLSKKDVNSVLATCERDDYCIDVLRAYLIKAEEKVVRNERHSNSGNELIRLMRYVQKLGSKAMNCIVMARVPMPFGYVQHLRIFLLIWLMLLPLGLVESSGWVTILWTVIIAYGVIAIERWSTELGDPFGFDLSDLPLERLCDRIIDAVQYDFFLFRNGMTPLIKADREPFPISTEEDSSVSSETV